jgi:hypothetical protein
MFNRKNLFRFLIEIFRKYSKFRQSSFFLENKMMPVAKKVL